MLKKLDPKLIEIKNPKISQGKWKFGSRDVTGDLYDYTVVDRNFDAYKKWNFQIRVPDEWRKGVYIEVRVIRHPQKRCWANLEQRTINFTRCTIGDYRSKAYAKVTLADAEGEKNKVGTRRGQRKDLPSWLRRGFHLRVMNTVATTKGTDGNSQVVVLNPDDHDKMIRFYLATKAWVLHEGFTLAD